MMSNEVKYDKQEITGQVRSTFENAENVLERFPSHLIHTQPAPGSWSAANVADHLAKSNHSIAKALMLHGTKINRDPGERIAELESIFLDYSKKFDAPSFILPGTEVLPREEVLSVYRTSCQEIITLSGEVDHSEMINHRAFGDITKLEILHFVRFHTIRHTRQMENILESVKSNKK